MSGVPGFEEAFTALLRTYSIEDIAMQAAGMDLGLALAIEHPEYAQALYHGFRRDPTYPKEEVSEQAQMLINLLPLREEN